MPHFTTSRRVAVSPEIAFAVAADVAAYREFLPLLERSQIRGRKAPQGSGESFQADLVVAYAKLGLRESFVSKVVTDAAAGTVTATSSERPFKSLKAVWSIAEAPGGCDVTIAIDYVFSSTMLQLAAGSMMGYASQKIMDAFSAQALVKSKNHSTTDF